MDNKCLLLEDGTKLKYLQKKYNYFLNQTILIYGVRNSGKTTLIDEIMYLCRNHIVFPFVISQTTETGAFAGKVPINCIKNDITKEWIEQFLIKQRGRAKIYNEVNKLKNLKSLFDKIKSDHCSNLERTINDGAERCIDNIKNNPKLNFPKKKERINAAEKIRTEKLFELYRNNIRSHRLQLEKISSTLNKIEKLCLVYLDFKPHVMMIFDDCASDIKKWCSESTTIQKIFYNGRHYYITMIITTQDDKKVDPGLRKNSTVSIFTDQQTANGNIERGANNYTKYQKKRAELCIKEIFRDTGMGENHKKLVYLQTNSEDPFFYALADTYDDFTIGCPGVWKLDEKIEEAKGGENNNDESSFFDQYFNF
jgi:hypothetical protein